MVPGTTMNWIDKSNGKENISKKDRVIPKTITINKDKKKNSGRK